MFSGVIPFLGSLTNLVTLDLGENLLEAGDWTFFSSLTSCTRLQILYLHSNNLQGELPTSIGKLPKGLQWLLLNDNQITGFIPPDIGNLTSLTLIHMERNFLSGHIPTTLGNIQTLFVLNLAENDFSGEVPQSIGNLGNLSELYLEKNILSGLIPASLAGCRSLTRLNLSCNSFHGSIPPKLFSVSSLSEGLDLSYNKLIGPIPSEISSLNNLELLNLSNNQLSGKIPASLGQCLNLQSLRLDANYLEGSIPASLMNLRGIVEMDLSQNNLSGEIPSFFESFSSLQLLNLSFNNLQGTVPATGVFGNSSVVFIQGNKNLCTDSAILQLQPCITSTSKRKRTSYVVMVLVPLVVVVLVSLICAIAIIQRKKQAPKHPINQSSERWKRFSYHDLYKATGGFSSVNLVGVGGSGSVYRGTFVSEPLIAAVKVFRLDQDGTSKSFIAECEALRNTRHRNLIRVISLCSTSDPSGNEFKALVLEHMSNGSLESWLHPELEKHGSKRSLSLGLRITIATDIAAALDYLHNRCTPPLIHCDLKPSNVLLDNDMCARVGDFGLAQFLYDHPSESLRGARGSIGYIAPGKHA
jgi:Leucine-rich repeat (LRR) protein